METVRDKFEIFMTSDLDLLDSYLDKDSNGRYKHEFMNKCWDCFSGGSKTSGFDPFLINIGTEADLGQRIDGSYYDEDIEYARLSFLKGTECRNI